MSKRTPWFNVKREPPVNGDENSEYEWRCLPIHETKRQTLWWISRWSCRYCEWRGLVKEQK